MRFVTLARDHDLLPGVPAFPGPGMGTVWLMGRTG